MYLYIQIKMSKKIVAIGWWENWRLKEWTRLPYETGPMDQEIIRLTGKEHPNFLLIAHSQSLERQETYFPIMKDIYNWRYGCECKDLKSDKLLDKEYVQNLINWADIIYEWGWDTLSMIALWKETWFDEILKKARENWKVMCGVSAWANCWFKKCSSDSLRAKYWSNLPMISINCLWFVDWLFVPHSDEPGRQESVKDLLKDEIWFLLSNCAALEIIDDQYRLITSDATYHWIEKAFWKKAYWKDGKYIEEDIDDSPEFKNLSELYSKI